VQRESLGISRDASVGVNRLAECFGPDLTRTCGTPRGAGAARESAPLEAKDTVPGVVTGDGRRG
jgi:hypothetical protein